MKFRFISIFIFIFYIDINATSFLTKKQPSHFNFGSGICDWGVPLYLGIDTWILRDATLGAEFTARGLITNSFYPSVLTLGINGNYHFQRILQLPESWQLYGGGSFGLGYVPTSLAENINNFNAYRKDPITGYFVLQVGGKYWFNRQNAINVEIMAGSYYGIKLGITINPYEKWK
ncbi:MAG: hypothetical protein SFY32_00925 [Bacteroidota bacterium]|nr:hypothetical protein [Bacteroidota bacterium]